MQMELFLGNLLDFKMITLGTFAPLQLNLAGEKKGLCSNIGKNEVLVDESLHLLCPAFIHLLKDLDF